MGGNLYIDAMTSVSNQSPTANTLSFNQRSRATLPVRRQSTEDTIPTPVIMATSNNDEITRHLVLEENQRMQIFHPETNPSGIVRMHLSNSPGPRPLIILVLGRNQTLNGNPQTQGMLELYNRFRQRNDVDVILFRVGDLNFDPFNYNNPNNIGNVRTNTSQMISDLIHRRSLFINRQPPSLVAMAGFSWGGGTVRILGSEEWHSIGRNIPLAGTVSLDGIELGRMTGVSTKPTSSVSHLHIYQQNGGWINGAPLTKVTRYDASIQIPRIPRLTPLVPPPRQIMHADVDDQQYIIDHVYEFLNRAVQLNPNRPSNTNINTVSSLRSTTQLSSSQR